MANQTTDTQTQVVFSTAHLVNLTQVKHLGAYTKAEIFDGTLAALLAELRYAFSPEDILLKDQKVTIKLKNDVHPQVLTTSTRTLDSLEDEEKRESATSLFAADYVLLLIQLAKFLQLYAPTQLLKEFSESYTESYFFKEWADAVDSPTEANPERVIFSEASLIKNVAHVQDLLNLVEDALAEITQAQPGSETEKAEGTQATAPAVTPPVVEDIASVIARNKPEEPNGTEGDTTTSPEELTEKDADVLERQVAWVWGAAREQLIFDALRKLGIDPTNPPAEMGEQIRLLESLLRDTIRAQALALPPDKLVEFLSGSASITLRLTLLRSVLLSSSGINARFSAELLAFYDQCARFARSSNTPQVTEAFIKHVENIVSQNATDLTAEEMVQLEAIKRQLAAWKQSFAETQVAEDTAEEEETVAETIEERALQEDLEDIEPTAPSLHYHLKPAESRTISELVAPILQKPYEQKRVQNQVARLIAGTKAELFSEKDLRSNGVPEAFTAELSDLAIQYVLSLSPEEITQLSRSPSTLIRHIQTLYLKALQDPSFKQNYDAFVQEHRPPIERASIIEDQTEVLTQVVIDELFTNQTITDAATPDNYLQNEFDHLKGYLNTKIYYTVSELSTDELLKLQLDFLAQKKILERIHTDLTRDAVFTAEVTHFYSSLSAYYQTSGQYEKSTELEEKVRTTFKTTDGAFKLPSLDTATETAEFSKKISDCIKNDNPALVRNASTIVDSLLITYGRADTERLISNLSPEMLALTFGLPKGSLRGENLEQFRGVLLGHAQTREVLLSLYRNTNRPLSDTPIPVLSANVTATELNKVLSPVTAVKDLSAQSSSDVVAASTAPDLIKKRKKVIKGLISEWETLTYQEQYAIYYYTAKVLNDQSVSVGSTSGALFSKEELTAVRNDSYDVSKRLAFVQSYLFLREDVQTLVEQLKKDAFFSATHTPDTETQQNVQEITGTRERIQQTLALNLAEKQALLDELQATQPDQVIVITQQLRLSPSQLGTAYDVAADDPEALLSVPDTEVDALAAGAAAGGALAGAGQPSTRGRALQGLRALAKKKLGKKLAAKAGESAAGMALGAAAGAVTAGLGLVVTGAKSLWNFIKEPDRNPTLLFLLGMGILPFTNALGALAFSVVTFITGNVFLGLGAGLAATALAPNLQIPGLNFRMPPAPWQNWVGSGNDQVIHPQSNSLSQMRQAEKAGSAQSSQQGAQQASATSPTSTAATTSTTAATQSATAQASASFTGSTTSGAALGTTGGAVWGLSFGALAPLGGVFVMMSFTAIVLTVIYGAFLIPVPTRPSELNSTIVGNTVSKYVEVTKTANPPKIANNTATDITYTITIKPKTGYRIVVKSITDTFSGVGTSSSIPTSPLKIDAFPQDPIADSSEFTTSYKTSVGGGTVDALIMNAFILTFDVMDSGDFVLATDETVTAAASVAVGNPKMGCWPTSGKILQLPGGNFSHNNPYYLDAFDIANSVGTPIYAPFPGRLCDKGMDPKPSGGYGIHSSLEFQMNGMPLVLYFGHFSVGSRSLSSGFDGQGCKSVQAGEVIGLMGSTGYSFGSHLHYELLRNTANIKLKDVVLESQSVMSRFNSGQAVFVNHCFK